MGKSLTEIAKQILHESNDPTPDRDAKLMTQNKTTLRPKSGPGDAAPIVNPGSTPPVGEVQDLGPALVKQGDVPPSAKASGKTGKKDTSASSQSRAGTVPAQPAQSLAEEEDVELSEELEAFIDALVAEGKTEEEIAKAIDENFEIVDGESIQEEETPVVVPEKIVAEKVEVEAPLVDMSEHINALFSGETLSEEFKEKATTIFEAAVKQKLEEEIALLESTYQELLDEEIKKIEEELSSSVDDYLNYVVEEWVKSNEVALESGLKSELTEDFISGLKNLFAEHYIDIPEDKVSVVEEMSAKLQDLEEKYNNEIERATQINKALNEEVRKRLVSEAGSDLTDSQADKLNSLSEGIEFTNEKEFTSKLNVLRENYFKVQPVVKTTQNVLDNDGNSEKMISESVSGPMEKYLRVLNRTTPTHTKEVI